MIKHLLTATAITTRQIGFLFSVFTLSITKTCKGPPTTYFNSKNRDIDQQVVIHLYKL